MTSHHSANQIEPLHYASNQLLLVNLKPRDDDYSAIDLRKYRATKYLHLNVHAVGSFRFEAGIKIMNNLTMISLMSYKLYKNEYWHRLQSDLFIGQSTFESVCWVRVVQYEKNNA